MTGHAVSARKENHRDDGVETNFTFEKSIDIDGLLKNSVKTPSKHGVFVSQFVG